MLGTNEEGYVFYKGRLQHAIRVPRNSFAQYPKVARYTPDSPEGIWCGKKVASTFFVHKWHVLSHDELMAKVEYFARLNRVMPEVQLYRADAMYKCHICGVLVLNRLVHLQIHQRPIIMHEIVESLWGTVEESTESGVE